MRLSWIVVIVIAAGSLACDQVQNMDDKRIDANEMSAIVTLNVIVSGEMLYSASCGNGGYAVSLPDLAKPPQAGAGFVSPDLAGGTTVTKAGYKVSIAEDATLGEAGTAGSTAETCNGSEHPPARSYFASAEPEVPGKTGRRYFAADARGTVYASPNPISNPIVPSDAVVPVR